MAYVRTMRDYDGEATVFSVNSALLNAGNIASEIAANTALGVAIAGITRGTVTRITYGNEIDSPGVNSDPLAQRENKWLIRYHDTTTGKNHKVELGTADLMALDPNNRGYAYIGDGDVVDAFVSAFEAFVLAPETNNAVAIDSIQFVGRNT
jgi:hypothetical protein